MEGGGIGALQAMEGEGQGEGEREGGSEGGWEEAAAEIVAIWANLLAPTPPQISPSLPPPRTPRAVSPPYPQVRRQPTAQSGQAYLPTALCLPAATTPAAIATATATATAVAAGVGWGQEQGQGQGQGQGLLPPG